MDHKNLSAAYGGDFSQYVCALPGSKFYNKVRRSYAMRTVVPREE